MMNCNINAKLLRSVTESADLNIEWILRRCLADAGAGEDLHVHYGKLNDQQIEAFKNLGFDIIRCDKEEDKFLISW